MRVGKSSDQCCCLRSVKGSGCDDKDEQRRQRACHIDGLAVGRRRIARGAQRVAQCGLELAAQLEQVTSRKSASVEAFDRQTSHMHDRAGAPRRILGVIRHTHLGERGVGDVA